MKHLSFFCLAGLLLFICLPATSTAQQAPYTEGSVWGITLVRVKSGMGDDYLRSLASAWKTRNEALKKQGLILSYKILSGDAANKDDWDMMLMMEYKNMASFDGFDEKFRAIEAKVVGSEEQLKNIMIKRIDVREIFGSKVMRELILK